MVVQSLLMNCTGCTISYADALPNCPSRGKRRRRIHRGPFLPCARCQKGLRESPPSPLSLPSLTTEVVEKHVTVELRYNAIRLIKPHSDNKYSPSRLILANLKEPPETHHIISRKNTSGFELPSTHSVLKLIFSFLQQK